MKIFNIFFKKTFYFLIIIIISSLLYIISSLYIPFIIGKIIDSIFINDSKLLTYILIYLFILLISTLFNFIFEYVLYIYVEKISKYLKDKLFHKILNLKVSNIDNIKESKLSSIIINDVDNFTTAIRSFFKNFINGILTLIITFILMFYINYLLALIVLILTPIALLSSYKIAKKSVKYYKRCAELNDKLMILSNENINNNYLIKSYNYQNILNNKYNKINDELNKNGQKAQFISSLVNPSTRLINNFIYILLTFVGCFLVVLNFKNFSIGLLSAFLQYAMKFSKPLNEISSCINEIELGYTSYQRINNILEEGDELNSNKNIFIKDDIKTIEFKDVSFSYDNKRNVIKSLNFTIHKGEKIAIVGPTGSGKTTIINLILGFYEPCKGKILINNEDISQVNIHNYRTFFKTVLQESWIFHDSVINNITYGLDSYSLNEVVDACKKVSSYEFINRLPNKFNSVIDEHLNLSIGEKQLINISRAILNKPEIYIFDEMTSNIDTRNEIKIMNSFFNIMKTNTSIIIAHRLSTIKSCDKIYFVKDGEIIEQGTHQELLNKKGNYYKMYNSQFKLHSK
ncbi:MAG: ABC transporter ATP-binding protein [Bacillales bacterium]